MFKVTRLGTLNCWYSLGVKPLCLLLLLIAASSLIAACGRIRQEPAPAEIGVSLEMVIEPSQPIVGPARLIFTLTDMQGQAITDANLDVEGNMTHAGMVPVLAQAAADRSGRYVVPFEWTMSGDWIVTVSVTLADGQSFSQQLPVVVQ